MAWADSSNPLSQSPQSVAVEILALEGPLMDKRDDNALASVLTECAAFDGENNVVEKIRLFLETLKHLSNNGEISISQRFLLARMPEIVEGFNSFEKTFLQDQKEILNSPGEEQEHEREHRTVEQIRSDAQNCIKETEEKIDFLDKVLRKTLLLCTSCGIKPFPEKRDWIKSVAGRG